MTLLATTLLAGCTGTGDPPPSGPPSAPAPATPSTGSTPRSSPSPSATDAPMVRVVPLAPGVSDEASGIAASTTVPDRFFLIDDGTGADELAVVDDRGTLVTRVTLTGMDADNAEALGGGPCGSIPVIGGARQCLYVGDIGDNRERRDDVVVYRAGEPDLTGAGPHLTVAADEWRYTYPDRPQNAESMLVAPDGSIIVITKPKGVAPHRLYRGEPGGGTLAFIREFQVPASPRPMRTILTGNVATDAAATPGRVLLLTYDDVHEYTAPDPSAALSSFPDWPTRPLPFPDLPQAEAIAGAPDGCGYVVASEAGPAGSAGSLGLAACR